MAIFFKAENIKARGRDMDKSTLDIFFNDELFFKWLFKKDDYAIPHQTIIISMVFG